MISHLYDCRVVSRTLTWTPVVGQVCLSNWEMQLHSSRLRSTWSTFFGILFVLSPHSGLLRCVLFHLSKYCTAFLHIGLNMSSMRESFPPYSVSFTWLYFSPSFFNLTPLNLLTFNLVTGAQGMSLVCISVYLKYLLWTVWGHFLVNYCHSVMYAPMNLPHCITCDLKGCGMPRFLT